MILPRGGLQVQGRFGARALPVSGRVPTPRGLLAGGGGAVGADAQGHAHLPVPHDRAPSVHILGDHPGVHRRGGPRVQPPGGGSAVQDEVVHRGLIRVGDLQDEPVPGGHGDLGRLEAHRGGGLHRHPGGVPRAGRLPTQPVQRPLQTRGVQGQARGHAQRGQARPGVDLPPRVRGRDAVIPPGARRGPRGVAGRLGGRVRPGGRPGARPRPRGRPRRGPGLRSRLGIARTPPIGCGRPGGDHRPAGGHLGAHGADHQGQEGRQGEDSEDRGDGPHPGPGERGRQDEQDQAQLHHGHPQPGQPGQLPVPGAHRGGPSAHGGRQQVGHRPQQHLHQEARDEHRRHRGQIQTRPVGAQHEDPGPHGTRQQPADPGQHGQPGVVPRGTGAGHAHQPPQQHHNTQGVGAQARGRRRAPADRGRGRGAQDAGQQQPQRETQARQGALRHPGAQDRGPQGQQGPGDREPDEAQHVHRLVSQLDPGVPGRAEIGDAEHRPQHRAHRQQPRRGDVPPDRDREASRQGRAQLAPQGGGMPGDGPAHQHRPAEHRRNVHGGVRGEHHPRDQDDDAEVQRPDPPQLGGAGGVREAVLEQGLGEVLGPDQDGVGDQPQGHEVHQGPSGLGQPPVEEHGEQQHEHPHRDRAGGSAVPAGPAAARASCLLLASRPDRHRRRASRGRHRIMLLPCEFTGPRGGGRERRRRAGNPGREPGASG